MAEPKLRLKKDDGTAYPDWEYKPLRDFMKSRDIRQVPSIEAPLKAFIANVGVADKGEKYDRSALVKSEDKTYKRTEYNDFIYSSNNLDVGSIGLNKNGTAVISDVYEIFQFKSGVNPDCMNMLIQWPRNLANVIRYRQGALYGQYRIYAEDFLSVKVNAPGEEEQKKIAEFLSSVDELIATSEEEVSNLEQQKKAAMQAIFSRKVRFKKEDGSEFPEWEETTFEEVFEPLNNNTMSRANLNYDGGTVKNIHYGDVLITYGELCDVTKGNVPYVNVGEKTDNFVKLMDGDIIIADTAEDDTVGKATEIVNCEGMEVISGLHTIACRPKFSFAKGYLGYYINSSQYHSQLWRLKQGTKVYSVSRKLLADTTILYPHKDEQKLIADFLTSFDEAIAAAREELEKYKQLKKGLLQQMFV